MIDERGRHQLYLALEEHLGVHEADTLMELLPPVGWADVATKSDLHALEERMDLRFEAVDLRFEAIDRRFDSMEARFDSMEHRFATKDDLAAFATKTDLAALQRSLISMMVGMLFTVTAILLTAMSLIR